MFNTDIASTLSVNLIQGLQFAVLVFFVWLGASKKLALAWLAVAAISYYYIQATAGKFNIAFGLLLAIAGIEFVLDVQEQMKG